MLFLLLKKLAPTSDMPFPDTTRLASLSNNYIYININANFSKHLLHLGKN